MKRGDVVTVAAAGDYGKPRPAVMVQTDAFTASDGFSRDGRSDGDKRLASEVASHGREARHDPARTNWTADRPS